MISLAELETQLSHHRWRSLHMPFRWAFPEMDSNNRAYGLPELLSPEDLDAEEKRDETRGGIPSVYSLWRVAKKIGQRQATSERDRNRRSLDR
jgi:hypothetical protein